MVGPQQPPIGLVVHFQGHPVRALRTGDPPFTFGRSRDRTLRFGHDVLDGGPDLHIPRNVGSIRCDDGLWVVCNDSKTRPFDIVVRGVSNPLPPRSSADSRSVWAICLPGLEIKVVAPTGRYLLSVSLHDPAPPVADQPGRGDPSTVPLDEPTDHDRLLLAAKFLALPDPGDAVGNREAAEYATAAARALGRSAVTERAVDNCVGRWCRRLRELGVTGISGRENIHQLGRQLLAWGILHQEDRDLLRPEG